MGYKVLGYLVWRGAKWYLRRRVTDQQRRMVFAGLAALALAGAVAGQRAVRSPAGNSAAWPGSVGESGDKG